MSPSKKKLSVKGLGGRCLSEFIDWRYSQSWWFFQPSCVNCCPSKLLSGSLPPPPPPFLVSKYSIQNTLYRQCVAGRGWGVEYCCRSLTLCVWPDSEPTKLPDHPKQKPRRGGGLRQINTWGPFLGQFFRWRHFCFGVCTVNYSMMWLLSKRARSACKGFLKTELMTCIYKWLCYKLVWAFCHSWIDLHSTVSSSVYKNYTKPT